MCSGGSPGCVAKKMSRLLYRANLLVARNNKRRVPGQVNTRPVGGRRLGSAGSWTLSSRTAHSRGVGIYVVELGHHCQIMACRLLCAKPFPEQRLTYCQLHPQERRVKFESKYNNFLSRNCINAASKTFKLLCSVDHRDRGHLTTIGIPIVEIRRYCDRLISTMRFLIRTEQTSSLYWTGTQASMC